jgi:hypothetical protein
MSQAKRIDWHRWFGIGLTEHFHGTPWRVELEKELALKRQLLDVVIIEQADSEATLDPAALDLPDGLENLRAHNLLTYKSHQEALDAWALDELIGHYVNYRKLLVAQQSDTSAAEGDANNNQTHLLPEAAFQLYAVATREPLKLLRQLPASALQPTDLPGVHDLKWGLRQIRLIVLDAVADTPRNALWEIFSTNVERVRQGLRHYHRRSTASQDLLYRLILNRLGLPAMTYTVEDFIRESREEFIADLTPEERRAIVNEMPFEERRAILNQLPFEERRAILNEMLPEERRAVLDELPFEERRAIVNELPLEERRALLNELPFEERRAILNELPPEERRAILNELPFEERQAIFNELPFEERQAILNEMLPEERRAMLEQIPLEERLRSLDLDQLQALDPEVGTMLRKLLSKLE